MEPESNYFEVPSDTLITFKVRDKKVVDFQIIRNLAAENGPSRERFGGLV